MDKQTIINRLANICYRPKIKDDDDFAVQRFIEALVISDDKDHYTLDEMKQYITKFLEDSRIGEKLE